MNIFKRSFFNVSWTLGHLQDTCVFSPFLITGEGNTSCYGILFKSEAASAARPRTHEKNEGDKQGGVKGRWNRRADGPVAPWDGS